MIGFALAALAYQRAVSAPKAAPKAAAPADNDSTEGEIEDDEL